MQVRILMNSHGLRRDRPAGRFAVGRHSGRLRAAVPLAGWLFACASGCVARAADDPDRDDVAAIDHIIAASRRATGAAQRSGVFAIRADASVQGPRGTFRTTIISRSDGLVLMDQSTGFVAGVDTHGSWASDGTTQAATELDAGGLATVRGHELHMLALYPETRAIRSRLEEPVIFEGDSALAITHELPGGEKIIAFFSRQDTLPLGFEMSFTQPVVTVTLSEWSGAQPRLFRRAVFHQADERFTYDYDNIAAGMQPDSMFERPGSRR